MFLNHWQPGWRDCYTAWLSHVYQRSGSDMTMNNYVSVLKRFFEACGKEPHMVLRSDVEAFASSPLVQQHKGKAPAAHTRNSRIMAISSFYAYACGYEYINGRGELCTLTDRNPCKGIRQSRTQASYRSISLDEFKKFLSVIPQDDVRGLRDFAVFQTLYWTCQRLTAVCSLRFGNIHKTSFVDPQTKQSREGWTYTVARIKGGASHSAELPLPAAQAIQQYLRISGRLETIQDDQPIFIAYPPHEWPPVDPWRPITGLSVWRRMKIYLHAAGLDEAVSPHFLRHGGALARYLYADSGPVEIMGLLSHADLRVTTRYLQDLNMSSSQDLAALRLQAKYGSF